MEIAINPLSDVLGAEVTGFDLKADLNANTLRVLNAALAKHIVVCIRDQQLDADSFIEVSGYFGPLMSHTNKHLVDKDRPALNWVTSEDRDIHGTGKIVYRGTTWHTDHSYMPEPPKATILYAVEVPSQGGDTSFCNLRKAYAALPIDTKKRLDGLQALHVYQSSRSPRKNQMVLSEEEEKSTPDTVQPLVRFHVDAKAPNLFMSTTRLENIVGMPREESDTLIDALFAHADDPQFHYHHKWRVGDYVLWYDRSSMHHANPDWAEGEKRFLYRTMVQGEKPVLAKFEG